MSAIGRNLGKTAFELTIDAVFEALDHAGLTADDIDGLTTMPGFSETPGMAPVPLRDLKNGLGLKLNWFTSIQEGPGTLSAIMNAAMAIATGQARHVLCFRTAVQHSARAQSQSQDGPARRWNGWQSWAYPFNALSPVCSFAMLAMARMRRYGLTREQLGAWVLNCRSNAGRNPRAVYRDPMTLEDYLAARMIADPLCLYDCDAPIDGSVAVIVSALEAARDLNNPPLRIEAMSGALYGKDSWDQFDDITSMAARDAAARLWTRTDLKPADIDLANLYDGFSIQPLVWLESLGFCGKGESGAFVAQRGHISLDGQIPMNTGGGQLSGGRMHGFGLLRESCLQLWRQGGERQVAGDPEVALTAVGAGALAGCLVLTRI